MPNIDKLFLESLEDDYKNYNIFIETGTYLGNTIFGVEPLFNQLYTIEFSEKLYLNTKQKYNSNKIKFILGDSSVIFETLLPSLKEKAIFFLDGHWSSGDTGRSNKDCPLNEEIIHINNLFLNEAIIIIDDHRLFGKSPKYGNLNEDWSDINEENIISILKKRINKIYYKDSFCSKNDRMIIHINKLL